MEKCKYCKQNLKKEEINIHEFNCVSSFGNDNILENLIPCEICNQLIEFDNYNDHIASCGVPILPRFYFRNNNSNSLDIQSINDFLNQLNNIPINNNLNDNQNDNVNDNDNVQIDNYIDENIPINNLENIDDNEANADTEGKCRRYPCRRYHNADADADADADKKVPVPV